MMYYDIYISDTLKNLYQLQILPFIVYLKYPIFIFGFHSDKQETYGGQNSNISIQFTFK